MTASLSRLLDLRNSGAVKYFLDLLLWTLCGGAAFFLRVDDAYPRYMPTLLAYLALSLPFRLLIISAFKLYSQSWRAVGIRDLFALLQAVAIGTLTLFIVGLLAFYPVLYVPRSIPIIEGILAVLTLGGARMLARLLHEERARGKTRGRLSRVLVAGAGEAGTLLVREMLRHPEAGLRPIGYIDDDAAKQHKSFLGLPVFGTLDDLPRVVNEKRIHEVLIAIPSADGRVIRRLVSRAQEAGVKYRSMPGLYEILSGRVSISQIREVGLEDLLRREPVKLNLDEISGYLRDRVVLLTGAGGSIGAEILRQVLRFNPCEVIMLGRGENSLYQVETELARHYPDLKYRIVIADVRERDKLEHIFRQFRPQVVFHVAAHKHVPLMEQNPDEAVFNNVVGTQNVAELALHYNVERFVNISTDKAINPASIMGASKRVAEMLVEKVARAANNGQMFVSVRFGNVLGSRGSVVPLFKEQIARGGPVTVTHPDMTRYFMTIPEAAQLVLQAGGLDMNGALFVLDMGEPVKIVDLARDMILLSGFKPDVDIEIRFTGMRPGEKLFEELLTENETMSRHEKIYVVSQADSPTDFDSHLAALIAAAKSRDDTAIRQAFAALIPTYQPPAENNL